MLVLTRKNLEAVVVGGAAGFERLLKVTVLGIDAGKVKLGFEVDKHVPVHRLEVWEKIQANGFQPGLTAGPEPPVADGNGHAPRTLGILIADDEPTVRSVLSAALRQQGFAVWLAADGQEAIELYLRHSASIDIILLDVRMPELDGPQSLAVLRAINPEVRCCFMSGDVGSHAEAKVGHLSAAAVIQKPFQPLEVARTLWELASRPKGRLAPV